MKDSKQLIQIYQCFCDETRLRIINLLIGGPLCVCHIQDLLNTPQVKISKHLGYLKENGLVEVQRYRNWMIYSLPARIPAELESNLKCLQDCVQTHSVFNDDLQKAALLRPMVGWLEKVCVCNTPAPLKQQPKGSRGGRRAVTATIAK